MASSREYDIVVFGATGFTGQRIAANLASSSGFGGRWALGGRDRGRLEKLAASLAVNSGAAPGVVVANVDAPSSLLDMARWVWVWVG